MLIKKCSETFGLREITWIQIVYCHAHARTNKQANKNKTKQNKKSKTKPPKTVSAFWLFSKRCPLLFSFLLFIIDFMRLNSFIKATYINFTIELKLFLDQQKAKTKRYDQSI